MCPYKYDCPQDLLYCKENADPTTPLTKYGWNYGVKRNKKNN